MNIDIEVTQNVVNGRVSPKAYRLSLRWPDRHIGSLNFSGRSEFISQLSEEEIDMLAKELPLRIKEAQEIGLSENSNKG